ncbi:unnamed protein product, partial [Prorocentrum cordatum]
RGGTSTISQGTRSASRGSPPLHAEHSFPPAASVPAGPPRHGQRRQHQDEQPRILRRCRHSAGRAAAAGAAGAQPQRTSMFLRDVCPLQWLAWLLAKSARIL